MFEKILEKILIQYFGRFITGLDKNNLKLGVWSGNMVIENVNLNPEVIELIELPLKLKRSSIGKMTIKIPWKKLSSAPVEITIENIFVTVVPLEQNEWQFSDEIIVLKKFQGLSEYCKKCIKKGLKKKKEKKADEDQGYLDKMAIKIMDNIQLKIVNIHVSYEGPYTWGITLESLEIFTTDEQWRRQFVDKTENKNQIVPMNKLFNLQNLALYWNTKPIDTQQDYQQFMDQRILRGDQQARQLCSFVIAISADMLVLQNHPSQNQLPLYDMQLNLDQLNILLQREQFQQIVHLFENFSTYSKLLWIQRKQIMNVDEEKLQVHQKNFAILFPKIQLSENKSMDILDEGEIQLFKDAIRAMEYPKLLDWVQISAKQLIREAKLTNATKHKKKKESAWWKGGDKKNADDVFLNEEEIIAIDDQIERIFQEERKRVQAATRPGDSQENKFQFSLKGGQILINNNGDGIQLSIGGMICLFESQHNESFEVMFKLQNMSLDLINDNQLKPFCYKQKQYQLIEQLLKLHFKRLAKSEDEDASLIIQIDPIECNYESLFIKRWNDFFAIENVSENIVQVAAHDTLNKVQNQTESKIDQILNSALRLNVYVSIASPQIILNTWVVNLGNLTIQSEKDSKFYDFYQLQLSNVNISAGDFQIIKQLELQLQVERIKGALKHPDKPRMILSGIVPPIQLNLNEQIQQELFNIDKLIFPQKSDREKLEDIEKRRQIIFNHAKYCCIISKKDQYLWNKYYGVLSGHYIYFYKKQDDLQWEERVYLKDTNLLLKNDTIVVQSQSKSTYLKGEEQWVTEIRQFLEQFKDIDDIVFAEEAKVDKSLLQLQFKLCEIAVTLNNSQGLLYELSLIDILYKGHKSTNNFDFSFILGSLNFKDYIHNFENLDYQYLIKTEVNQEDAFLNYETFIENNQRKSNIVVGKFLLNWKPDTYIKLSQLGMMDGLEQTLQIHALKANEAELLLQGQSQQDIKKQKVQELMDQQNINSESQTEKFKQYLLTHKLLQENIDMVKHLFVNINTKIVEHTNIKVSKATVNLIHRESHICLGQVVINDLAHNIEVTQIVNFINGTINEVQLIDTTNYPQTLSAYNPVVILSASAPIQYQYAFYNSDYIKDSNESITSFSQLNIKDITLEYQHQQLNRFINYLLVQVLRLIFEPEYLTVNDNSQQPILVCGTVEKIFNTFMKPQFQLMEYIIENATIIIKQNYKTESKLTINADKINYQNVYKQDMTRLIQSNLNIPLWLDSVNIDINGLVVSLDSKLITNKVNYRILWERLLFEDEIQSIFDGIELRNTIELFSIIDPVELELNHSQFILLNTILAHNFVFNDNMDQLFIHNYSVRQQLAPVEVRFMIYLNEIQATLNKDNGKFLIAYLWDTQIESFMAQNDDKCINIFASQFHISQIVQSQDNQTQNPIMGRIGSRQQSFKSYAELQKQWLELKTHYINDYRYLTRTKQRNDVRPKFVGYELQIDFMNHYQKELMIDFDNCYIKAETKVIIDLLQYIELDDSCFPETTLKPKDFASIINAKNTVVIFPGLHDTLVARGNINYIFEKHKDIKSQKITFQHLELFICSAKELLAQKFTDIEKRHLMMPAYAYIGIVEQQKKKYLETQVDISLDKLCFKLGYSDLNVVMAVVKFQGEQIVQHPNIESTLNQLIVNVQCYQIEVIFLTIQECPVPLFDFTIKDTQVNFTKIKQYILTVQTSIYVCFFNVDLGIWEPVIEPFLMIMDHAYNHQGNPKVYTSLQINPKDVGDFILPFNINLTFQSIKALKNLIDQWNKAIKQVENVQPVQASRRSSIMLQSPGQNKDDKILAISPYILNNQTGFNIESTLINKTSRSIETVSVMNNQQQSIKYQENFFNIQEERKFISIKMLDEHLQFKDISNLDFKKNKDELLQAEYKIGLLTKLTNVLISMVSEDQCKTMTVSSDIMIRNSTADLVEIKLIHKNAQIAKLAIVLPGTDMYIPIGYDQSIIQLKYRGSEQWCSPLELQKICSKNQSIDLFFFEQCPTNLILTSHQKQAANQCTKIILQCPYALLNMLPVPIIIHLSLDQPLEVKPFQPILISSVPLSKNFRFNIKIPGFQMSPPIEVSNKFNKPIPISLRDYLTMELTLQLIPLGSTQGFVTVMIDGGVTYQNSLGQPLYLYGRQKDKKEDDKKQFVPRNTLHPGMQYLAGQPIFGITDQTDDKQREMGCVQIINNYDYIQFTFEQGCMGQTQGNFSTQFPLCNAKDKHLIQIPLDEGFMEAIIDIQIILMDKNLQLSERLMHLIPKTVLVNNLSFMITIVQEKCNRQINLLPNAKFPFYWFSATAPKFIKIKSKELQSGSFGVEMQGTITLPVRDFTGRLNSYISISSREEDHTQFIMIEPTSLGQKPLYKIQNRMPFDLQFYQSEISELNQHIKCQVKSMEDVDYAFDNPSYMKFLTLELYQNDIFIDVIKVELSNAEYQVEQKMSDNTIYNVNSKFSLVERQIVVTFSMEAIKQYKHNYDNLSSQFAIAIPKINVSLVSQSPRTELLLISLANLEFVVLNDVIQTIQLKILDLQIDNNSNYRCIYPVLLTQPIGIKEDRSDIPIISCVIKRAHQVKFINYFPTVQLSVQPIVVRITQGTVQALEELFTQFKQFQTTSLLAAPNQWKNVKSISQKLCFFESIQLYPVKLILSYQTIEQKNAQYLKQAASSAINCDEAPLKLKGFGVSNIFITKSDLMHKIVQNYKNNLNTNMMKLIGSIEILGNPLGLVKNIGDGFYDLIDMPYEGFVKGPLEGGIGIAKGVGSLTKGVVSGTFNTVSKITGSIASGISQLSMDDTYLRERQLQNAKQAKTVVHGIGQGMVSLFQGVGLGITGLVTQPYEGAENGGVEGFFKGVSKGLAGLVIKPVVGAIDLASKTAEGLKNTANYFDDKPSEIRCRPPRPFYGPEQQFKNYNLQDAEVNIIMGSKLVYYPLEYIPQTMFIDSLAFQVGKYRFAYALTVRYFIVIEVLKKDIILQLMNENIKGFESCDKQYRIYLYASKIQIKDRTAKALISQRNDVITINEANKGVHQYLNQKLTYIM